MSIRVGIVGISGFGGGEALRLIASHPSFELVYAAGEGSAGSRLVDRFPGVTIAADLAFEPEAAAVLSDGAPPPRRFAGSGYVRGLTLAGRSIAGRLQAARDLIGARR